MTDYSNSVIYKLCHRYDYCGNKEYIGCTNNIYDRKKRHLNNCINENSSHYNIPLYQHIRDTGGFHNWIFMIIEKISCNSKKELQDREKYWIKYYKPKLNITTPNQSQKEWARDNIERVRATSRRFYYNNLEKERERARNVYEKYKHLHKEKKNKREINRYWDNKDEFNQKKAEKITCECGTIVCKGGIAKHKRTAKHIKLMEK